jgi:hypothetical protein
VTATQRPSTGGCLIGVGVLAFAAVMTTCILTIGIWPGEAKLTAPLLCPDDRPDAFVVADTYSVRPGETSTNFTLYCMGPRGETTEVGFFVPFLLLTLLHGAIILGLVFLLGARGAARRRRQGGEVALEPPPPGPEVPVPQAAPPPAPDGSDLPPAGPLIS